VKLLLYDGQELGHEMISHAKKLCAKKIKKRMGKTHALIYWFWQLVKILSNTIASIYDVL
jgi:hypothetical protein